MRPLIISLPLVGICLGWSLAAAAAEIEQQTRSIPAAGGGLIPAMVFTVNTRKIYIDVLPASSLSQSRPRDYADGGSVSRVVSLKDAANSSEVGRLAVQRALLVNGGFTENDRPDGLLISRDEVVSLPNFATRPADLSNPCPALRVEHKRVSGAMCVTRDRNVSIQPIEKVNAAACYQALQAGPILVAPGGHVDVCPVVDATAKKIAAQLRTVVCLRGDNLSVVLTQAPAELYDMAKWLAAPTADGGMACDSALNLAGGAASGAVYFPGGFASMGARKYWGGKKQPNASYLFLHTLK